MNGDDVTLRAPAVTLSLLQESVDPFRVIQYVTLHVHICDYYEYVCYSMWSLA